MAESYLGQLDFLQKMIDLQLQKLKDLREKQLEARSDLITSEINDLEVCLTICFPYAFLER